MELLFEKIKNDKDIRQIHEFNVKAFSDEDLNWTYENLKNYISSGWELYAAKCNKDIVSAIIVKEDDDSLITKNSSIGVDYQGNGFSHRIKDYYEQMARQRGMDCIISLCPFDNFRMISLNERHDYKKTGRTFGPNSEVVEWAKKIS